MALHATCWHPPAGVQHDRMRAWSLPPGVLAHCACARPRPRSHARARAHARAHARGVDALQVGKGWAFCDVQTQTAELPICTCEEQWTIAEDDCPDMAGGEMPDFFGCPTAEQLKKCNRNRGPSEQSWCVTEQQRCRQQSEGSPGTETMVRSRLSCVLGLIAAAARRTAWRSNPFLRLRHWQNSPPPPCSLTPPHTQTHLSVRVSGWLLPLCRFTHARDKQ